MAKYIALIETDAGVWIDTAETLHKAKRLATRKYNNGMWLLPKAMVFVIDLTKWYVYGRVPYGGEWLLWKKGQNEVIDRFDYILNDVKENP